MEFYTLGNSVKGLREYQQDCLGFIRIGDHTVIMVVADGNGGIGGEIVSETCIKLIISKLCYEFSRGRSIKSEKELESFGIEAVNYTCDLALSLKEIRGEKWADAGSTLTLVLIINDLLGVFWVGDSSSYLFSDGKLVQLTSPVHTLAEMLIAQGEPRDVINSQPSLNSTLTRCVGYENCAPDAMIMRLKGSGIVLAGSDGVFGYLPEYRLTEALQKQLSSNSDIKGLPDELINLSLDCGSDDNCTVVTTMFQDSGLIKSSRRLTKTYEWI